MKSLRQWASRWNAPTNDGRQWLQVSMAFKEAAPSSAASLSQVDVISNSDSGVGIEEMLTNMSKTEGSVLAVRLPKEGKPYGEVRLVMDTDGCQAGDYVAVTPKNDPKDIESLINILKLDRLTLNNTFDLMAVEGERNSTAKDVFRTNKLELTRVPQPTTIAQVLSDYLDLSGPISHKLLMRTQKRFGLTGRWLQASKSKKVFAKLLEEQPNIINLLLATEKLVTLEFLLLKAPLIQPRCYMVSVCSAHSVTITYRPVEKGGKIGLCSKYLQSLAVGDKVNAVLCRGSALALPEDMSRNVVIFAGYIGWAPFRPFMETKLKDELSGRLLFFAEVGEGFLQIAQKLDKYRPVATLVFAPTASTESTEGEGLIRRCEQTEWKTQLPTILRQAEVYCCGSPSFCRKIGEFVRQNVGLNTTSPSPPWYHEEKICREVSCVSSSSKDKKKGKIRTPEENLSFA